MLLKNYPELMVSIMHQAFSFAGLSYARRRKTGAIVLRHLEGKEFTPVAFGYNGTRPGESNLCEDANGDTLDTVIHAERNCIRKMMNQGVATPGSILVVTFVPCPDCVELIIDAKFKEVIYCHDSNNPQKVKGLEKLFNKVSVSRVDIKDVIEWGSYVQDGLNMPKFLGTVAESENKALDRFVRTKSIEEIDRIVKHFFDTVQRVHRLESTDFHRELYFNTLHRNLHGTRREFFKWCNLAYETISEIQLKSEDPILGIEEFIDFYLLAPFIKSPKHSNNEYTR